MDELPVRCTKEGCPDKNNQMKFSEFIASHLNKCPLQCGEPAGANHQCRNGVFRIPNDGRLVIVEDYKIESEIQQLEAQARDLRKQIEEKKKQLP